MAVGGERKIFFCEASFADGSRWANDFLMRDFPAQSPVSKALGRRCRKRRDVIVKKRRATFDRVGHLLAVSEKIQLVDRKPSP